MHAKIASILGFNLVQTVPIDEIVYTKLGYLEYVSLPKAFRQPDIAASTIMQLPLFLQLILPPYLALHDDANN